MAASVWAADLRVAQRCITQYAPFLQRRFASAARLPRHGRPSIRNWGVSGHPGLGLRLASSLAPLSTATTNSSVAFQFPPRILIYHAGTGRVVFVGCTKIATILVLAFACLVVAPAVYYAEEIRIPLPWATSHEPAAGSTPSAATAAAATAAVAGPMAPAEGQPASPPAPSAPTPATPAIPSSTPQPAPPSTSTIDLGPSSKTGHGLLAASVIAAGFVPLLFVLHTSRAFVAYIHLSLPPAARQSRAALHSWSANIPANTKVDITSLRNIGTARQTSTVMGELREARARVVAGSAARGARQPRPSPTSNASKLNPSSSHSKTSAAARAATADAAAASEAATASSTSASASAKSFSPALAARRTERLSGRAVTRYGDVEIAMTRRRFAGWQPPEDPGASSWWRLREQSRFVVAAGRNRAAEQNRLGDERAWEGFLMGIGRGGGGDGGES